MHYFITILSHSFYGEGVAIQSAEEQLETAQDQLNRSLSEQDRAVGFYKQAQDQQETYKFQMLRAQKEAKAVKAATQAMLGSCAAILIDNCLVTAQSF